MTETFEYYNVESRIVLLDIIITKLKYILIIYNTMLLRNMLQKCYASCVLLSNILTLKKITVLNMYNLRCPE